MRTRKELAVKDCQRQIALMQEKLMTNTAFSLEERLSLVNYLGNVRGQLKEILTDK